VERYQPDFHLEPKSSKRLIIVSYAPRPFSEPYLRYQSIDEPQIGESYGAVAAPSITFEAGASLMLSGDKSDEEDVGIDIFQEPSGYYPPEKPHKFIEHSLKGGKKFNLRLLGQSPLWV
jgi:hypothetical protein